MPIDEFFQGQERARREIDTRELAIQSAYLKGLQANLTDAEGNIDRDQFSNKFETIVDVVIGELADGAKKGFKITTAVFNDPFKRELAIQGYYGLSRDTIKQAVGAVIQNGGNPLDLGDFVKSTGKYTESVYRTLSGVAMSFLKPEDAEAVIKKVDPTNQYNLDPAHDVFKQSQVLAELLQQFKEAGVITPRYVKARPQIFKEAVKAQSPLYAVQGGRVIPASNVP